VSPSHETSNFELDLHLQQIADRKMIGHVQLLADAAAGGLGRKTVDISDADALYTRNTVGSEIAGWFSAKPAFDMMAHESGEDYKS